MENRGRDSLHDLRRLCFWLGGMEDKIVFVSVPDSLVHCHTDHHRRGGSCVMSLRDARWFSATKQSPRFTMNNYALRSARESESRQIKELIRAVGINPMGLGLEAVHRRCGRQGPRYRHGTVETARRGPPGIVIHRGCACASRRGNRARRDRAVVEGRSAPLYLTCSFDDGA
jgi:hypothetical protein